MAGKKPLFSADAAEEYFSTLLRYYRNNGNDIFERDNEGRHASNQIYSAEYQKYLGMQIAMREVLEYFAKFELGDTAIRKQDHFREVTKRVEPLTMEELSKRNDPVFCQSMIFRMVGIGVCVKTDTSFLQVDTDLWQKRDQTGCFTARSRRRTHETYL